MIAQEQDSLYSPFCKVEKVTRIGKFTVMDTYSRVVIEDGDNNQLEQQVEKIGQEQKRILYQHAVEANDRQIANCVQAASDDLIKNGTSEFTFVTLFGHVKVNRQKLYNKSTTKTIIPSAIAWNTAQNRHINQSVIDQVCEDTQNESYRKATEQVQKVSGQESFLSTTCLWNIKQKNGKRIEEQQNKQIENVTKNHGPEMVAHGLLPADFTLKNQDQREGHIVFDTSEEQEEKPLSEEEQRELDELFFLFVTPQALEYRTTIEPCPNKYAYTTVEICTAIPLCHNELNAQEMPEYPLSPQLREITHENIRQRCHVEPGTISVQLDEVLSKSQEDGKKWNLTANATIEDDQGNVHYLTADNVETLLKLVGVHLVMLGVMVNKRLEILGDGALWIDKWILGLSGFHIVRILCWYHLSRKVYELLSGLGWDKARKKEFERKVLGVLWYGNVAEAIELLRGVIGEAKTPKRIEDLIGYLERKQDGIVNYAERHEQGLWIASTRVEKWNDLSVSDRCKRRGMSWTLAGVMPIAYYASEKRNGKLNLNIAN